MSARLTALVITLILVMVLGVWLHLSVVPDIAWQGHRGSVYTGWGAIRAAWPVYATAGALLGLLGVVAGLIVGGAARERDATTRAAVAERERDEAQQATEHAEQQAQLREAVAAQAQKDAEAQHMAAHQKLAEQTSEMAKLNHRLSRCREVSEARKKQKDYYRRQLSRQNAEALQAAQAEIERLKVQSRGDRQYILKLESQKKA